ncbi:MAG TPA: dihydrolipoamide acetyltransferase family protein [Dehalococcoidia bacterium]|nr:dihydrolipoamide acetyltransferase family protein [Dehalococcoidia bacterium]
MAFAVVLPKMGMTMVEGTITEWFVADESPVQEGDRLFSFETEKVDYEVNAEASGTLRTTQPVDAVVEAGGVCAYILAEGEELPPEATPAPSAPAASPTAPPVGAPASAAAASGRPARDASVKASPVAKKLAVDNNIDLARVDGTGPGGRVLKEDVERAIADGSASAAATPAAATGGRVKASPVAKRLAEANGIDLQTVTGSGPGGRIVKEDVERALAAPRGAGPGAALPPLEGGIAYRGIRRTIGQRMFESLQSMAQLTMTMEVDMSDAVRLRRDLVSAWEDDGPRVTYTDMVIKAAALALRDHPRVNAILADDTVEVQPQVHVGFAVALDEGLIVPVIRDADAKPLKQLASESAVLAGKAREGGLTPDDLTGGTFNVTSLGMFGVDAFTPIINPPQAAILGVGRISDRPAFVGNSGTDIERRSYLTISLTIDHRILDGAPGAQYMQSVSNYLEHPYLLLTTV